jgi:hypothetical protein
MADVDQMDVDLPSLTPSDSSAVASELRIVWSDGTPFLAPMHIFTSSILQHDSRESTHLLDRLENSEKRFIDTNRGTDSPWGPTKGVFWGITEEGATRLIVQMNTNNFKSIPPSFLPSHQILQRFAECKNSFDALMSSSLLPVFDSRFPIAMRNVGAEDLAFNPSTMTWWVSQECVFERICLNSTSHHTRANTRDSLELGDTDRLIYHASSLKFIPPSMSHTGRGFRFFLSPNAAWQYFEHSPLHLLAPEIRASVHEAFSTMDCVGRSVALPRSFLIYVTLFRCTTVTVIV